MNRKLLDVLEDVTRVKGLVGEVKDKTEDLIEASETLGEVAISESYREFAETIEDFLGKIQEDLKDALAGVK